MDENALSVLIKVTEEKNCISDESCIEKAMRMLNEVKKDHPNAKVSIEVEAQLFGSYFDAANIGTGDCETATFGIQSDRSVGRKNTRSKLIFRNSYPLFVVNICSRDNMFAFNRSTVSIQKAKCTHNLTSFRFDYTTSGRQVQSTKQPPPGYLNE